MILLLIIVLHQDGVAEVVDARDCDPCCGSCGSCGARRDAASLPEPTVETVPPATLSVENLTVRFGGVTAVDDVSFDVRPGEVVGLIGPNGAGKTTIIDAVTGFVKADVGRDARSTTVRINGWSATKRARRGLRRSFQSLELFEDVSVEDNIRAGADAGDAGVVAHRSVLAGQARSALDRGERRSTSSTSNRTSTDLPDELPYGRRRLVGIARAVASGPSVIMLDEPAAGLDETESRELASLIRRLADDRRMGVLLVEHDVDLVMSTCDRIIVLDFGRVIAERHPAEVRANPAVRDAYLGSDDADEELTTDDGTRRRSRGAGLAQP